MSERTFLYDQAGFSPPNRRNRMIKIKKYRSPLPLKRIPGVWLARGHWDGSIALADERSWKTIIGIGWNTYRSNYWIQYIPRKDRPVELR